MKVIIAGSRNITDIENVEKAVERSGFHVTEVVSGMATGVDTLGEQYAANRGIRVHQMPAQWMLHGRSAGYKRNVEMSVYADALVAVWDGVSKGTQHMIGIMRKAGKPVHVYLVDREIEKEKEEERVESPGIG